MFVEEFDYIIYLRQIPLIIISKPNDNLLGQILLDVFQTAVPYLEAAKHVVYDILIILDGFAPTIHVK